MGFNKRLLWASVMSTFIPSRIPYFFLSSASIVPWPLRVTVVSDSDTLVLHGTHLSYLSFHVQLGPCSTRMSRATDRTVNEEKEHLSKRKVSIMGVLHQSSAERGVTRVICPQNAYIPPNDLFNVGERQDAQSVPKEIQEDRRSTKTGLG